MMRTWKMGLGLAVAGSLFTGIALAQDIKDFDSFKKYVDDNKIAPSCHTCHQLNAKMVGPSYNAVALKYKGDAKAAETLAKKVIEGGSGVWGAVPMTPNPTAKDHAAKLVAWVLSLDPQGEDKTKAEAEIKAAPPKK